MSDNEETVELERCLECPAAFGTAEEAEAHYSMTGHLMGWPFEFASIRGAEPGNDGDPE